MLQKKLHSECFTHSRFCIADLKEISVNIQLKKLLLIQTWTPENQLQLHKPFVSWQIHTNRVLQCTCNFRMPKNLSSEYLKMYSSIVTLIVIKEQKKRGKKICFKGVELTNIEIEC